MDYEFVTTLDSLASILAHKTFICSWSNNQKCVEISNSFLASIPGHPFLSLLIDAIADHSIIESLYNTYNRLYSEKEKVNTALEACQSFFSSDGPEVQKMRKMLVDLVL